MTTYANSGLSVFNMAFVLVVHMFVVIIFILVLELFCFFKICMLCRRLLALSAFVLLEHSNIPILAARCRLL